MRTIDDILKTNGQTLWSVTPDTSINDAIKQMADRQVVAFPVLNAGKLVGAITEKDCIENVILKGKSTEETQVWEIMASNSVVTSPSQSVEECIALMTEKKIYHLPVISHGSLVGFVSMSDLFRTIIDDQKDYIYRLENYVLGISFA